MDMSTAIDQCSTEIVHKRSLKRDCIGLCINCGHRVTFCGKPFTAQIPCGKCLFINKFENSQQPVGGHW